MEGAPPFLSLQNWEEDWEGGTFLEEDETEQKAASPLETLLKG